MLQHHPSLSFLVGASLLLAACGSEPKETTASISPPDTLKVVVKEYDPAFSKALLDSASVAALISGDKTWGIRVYNARRTATDEDGTVEAIGLVEARGKEISGTDKDSNYRRYQALSGDRVVVDALGRASAVEAVKWVSEAGKPKYCAEFSKDEVAAMLAIKGMKAILFTPAILPTPDGTQYSMRAEAVAISGGALRGLGGSIVCDQPCPLYCGDMSYYLWE